MAKRHPFKPAVDTICDLYKFSPNSIITAAQFKREASSVWLLNNPGKELPGFIKWAKRYGLLKPLPGKKYQITAKGMRVAKKACQR